MADFYIRKAVETPSARNNPPLAPTGATISVSGQRFASYVQMSFEDTVGAFDFDYFRGTFYAYLNGEYLYRWGGVHAERALSGESKTYSVRLIIGSYRTNKSVLHISNGQLERTLYDYLRHFTQACIFIGQPMPVAGGPEDDGDVQGYLLSNSNTLARWSCILEYGYDPSVTMIPFDDARSVFARIGAGEELQRVIVANTISGPFYDDKVRVLWDNFGIMSILDLQAQSNISPDYALPEGLIDVPALDGDAICVPTQPMQGTAAQPIIALVHPLDPIPAAVFAALDDIETEDVKRNKQLDIDDNEPIFYTYYDDIGLQQWDYVGTLDSIFGDTEFEAWKTAGANELELPYRRVSVVWWNKARGLFEATLQKNKINRENHKVSSTIFLPETAGAVAKLLPGNPVKINGDGYWIVEAAIKPLEGVVELTLFDPSR